MTPIRQKLLELRSCLDKIQKIPLESETNVKAEVYQSLVIDKEGAEALAALSKDIDGNVFLINQAMVNMQVIRHGIKASNKLTEIEMYCLENGNTLDKVLDDLINKGWKLPEIERLVREKCFQIVEKDHPKDGGKVNQAKVARKLGVNRTTYLAQRKELTDG